MRASAIELRGEVGHASPDRASSRPPIRVGVVDDHPAVIWGLEAALERRPDIVVAARAVTAAGAAELLARPDLDVVLLDLRLPDGNGLDVLATAAAGGPAVIVLATFASRQHVSAARRLGARGYALKTASTEVLVEAVREVMNGGTCFPSDERDDGPVRPRTALTRRELALVTLIMAARSNDEIAASLGVAVKSIEARLTRLYERTGVGSRIELAILAEREGWLRASADPETGLPRYDRA